MLGIRAAIVFGLVPCRLGVLCDVVSFFFFFQAEDGIRDLIVTGVQTCALPICVELLDTGLDPVQVVAAAPKTLLVEGRLPARRLVVASEYERLAERWIAQREIGRASCRERV